MFLVKFKINFLEPCWVCAPPRNVMPSILVVFVSRQFLVIAYKFALRRVLVIVYREYFSITFDCSFIYSFIRF